MAGQNAAKMLLTTIAATQGIGGIAVEFNRTHATNERWPGHARFHLVWQALTYLLYGGLAGGLLWWTGPEPVARFYVAAAITAVPLLGFMATMFSRPLYGGALYDSNGILPVRVVVRGRRIDLHVNVILAALGLVLLGVALVMFQPA